MSPSERAERVGHAPVEAAPWCKDALFLVTTFGDGEHAVLVRGWEALCVKVVEVHFHDPEPEQRDEILSQLVDWEEWENCNGLPFHFHWSYEDGSVSVTRITDDESQSAHDDLVAALRAITLFGELASVSAEPSHSYPGGKKPASKEVWQFPRHLLTEIDAALSKAGVQP